MLSTLFPNIILHIISRLIFPTKMRYICNDKMEMFINTKIMTFMMSEELTGQVQSTLLLLN